jgi:hypothetical protein
MKQRRLLCFMACLLGPTSISLAAEAGQDVDIAPYGHAKSWDGNPGVEWDEPRDVRRIEVDFSDLTRIPDAGSLKVEYWVRSWPPQFRGGWTETESPWQGK